MNERQSPELERAVLSCLLLDSTLAYQPLEASDFADSRHQRLLGIVKELHRLGETPDELTVGQRFGDVAYVAALSLDLPDLGRYEQYVADLKAIRQLRELGRLCGSGLQEASRAGASPEDLLGVLRWGLDRIEAQKGFKEVGELAGYPQYVLGEIGTQEHALSTGYSDLDLYLKLRSGELIILAGRPGQGKSVVAQRIATHTAKQGLPVGWFSLEMSKKEIVHRIFAADGSVPLNAIRSNQLSSHDRTALRSVAQLLGGLPLYLDDSANLRVEDIAMRCRKIKRQAGNRLALVVVDYLGLVSPPKAENRTNEVSKITRELKILAKELDTSVLALHQLNRALEHRSDPTPRLADLRDSGAVEQDADAVVFIHRPTVRDSDGNEVIGNEGKLIVAKNRNGECGSVPVRARLNVMRIEELAR